MIDLWLGDSRQTECVVGILAAVIGAALIAAARTLGSDVFPSAVLLLGFGLFQVPAAARGSASLRRVANAAGVGAFCFSLLRAVKVEAVVPVAFYGTLTVLCWLLWLRCYLESTGHLPHGAPR